MHPLIERQLAKHLGPLDGLEADLRGLTFDALRDFVHAVDAAYAQADGDRAMLERSLELTSEELMAHNASLADSLGTETQRAQENEQRLSLVMKTLAQGVIIFDMGAYMVDLNDEAAALLGVTREVALGKRVTHPDVAAVFLNDQGQAQRLRDLPGVRAFAEGRPVRNQLLGIRRTDGTEVFTRTTSAPMSLDGDAGPRYLLVSYVDVTAARLVERMKRDIITAASHELRTPLNGIRGFAALLERRTDIPQEAVEWASVIAAEANRLSRIGNDLLDAARLGADEAASRLAQRRLSDAVRAAVASASGPARAHTFSLRGDEDLELVVDSDRLDQVLLGVLEHALRGCPDGSEVVVEWTGDHDFVRLDLGCDGLEIGGDQMLRPSGGFIPGDAPPPEQRGGGGLDLLAVKRVVSEMGGSVTIATDPTGGSTLSISLPMTPPTEGTALS